MRPLALNFFDEELIGVSWSIVGQFVLTASATPTTSDSSLPPTSRARAILKPATSGSRSPTLAAPGPWRSPPCSRPGLRPPTRLEHVGAAQGQRAPAALVRDRRRPRTGPRLSHRRTQRAGAGEPSQALRRSAASQFCEGLAANFHGTRDPEITDWMDVPDSRIEHIADVLMARRGSGYKILLPLRDGYHAASAVEDYAPLDSCRAGRRARSSSSICPGAARPCAQYTSERIIGHLLDRAAERFRAGHEAHHIQIFLEEAHRLFNRDRFQSRTSPQSDPYVRLAREAGKYKLGMIYATEQPSSVEQDVLDNTANWVVAHLNSQTEIKKLAGPLRVRALRRADPPGQRTRLRPPQDTVLALHAHPGSGAPSSTARWSRAPAGSPTPRGGN